MITNTSLILKPLRDTPYECLGLIVTSAVNDLYRCTPVFPGEAIFVLPNADCAVEGILAQMFLAYDVSLLVSQIHDVPHFIHGTTGERLLEFRAP